jgi:flagellar basal body P-ring formation protein FlgA
MAQTFAPQPLDALQRTAETFLTTRLQSGSGGAAVRVTAGAVDPRLRLQRCTQPLDGVLSPTNLPAARMTVGVRCGQPAWTVYVPVNVETAATVLVLKQAAARHSSLNATDVELQLRRVPGLATTYLTDVEQLQGRHLRMAAAPGTALTADLLANDVLVKRGQRVTLIASIGTLEVRAQGEAIADATASGRVRVLNLNSRKVVEGQVESNDRVRVSL